MEIPSDPNLILEFERSHETIILLFNPIYRKQGRTERNKIIMIRRTMTSWSKSTPKWEWLSSLLTLVTERLLYTVLSFFVFFLISYLSLGQWSGSSRCIQLWATVMLQKSAWQYLCCAHVARSHRYCRPLADLLLTVHSLHAWLHKKSSCLVSVKTKKHVQSASHQHHLVVLASSNLLVL